jgi:hypothetical protein
MEERSDLNHLIGLDGHASRSVIHRVISTFNADVSLMPQKVI